MHFSHLNEPNRWLCIHNNTSCSGLLGVLGVLGLNAKLGTKSSAIKYRLFATDIDGDKNDKNVFRHGLLPKFFRCTGHLSEIDEGPNTVENSGNDQAPNV